MGQKSLRAQRPSVRPSGSSMLASRIAGKKRRLRDLNRARTRFCEPLEPRLMLATHLFDGDDYINVPHDASFELSSGTIAMEFTANDVSGRKTLFSKDAKGYGQGGHLSAFVKDGRVEVQLQSTNSTVTLKTEAGSVRAGEDYTLAITFGAGGFQVYLDGELAAWRPDVVTGINQNKWSFVLGANTAYRDLKNPNSRSDYFVGSLTDFEIYNRALSRAEVALIGAPTDSPGPTHGTTGTGLDQVIDMIYDDRGLNYRLPAGDITAGATNADAMNVWIVQAIFETGVANDHGLTVADIREINGYLQTHAADQWIILHGDDENASETGFHLVQNDGATSYLFGDENAIDTVADGIYHLGFAISNGRLLNEDGNENASLKDVTYWLNNLLADDLAGDKFVNPSVKLLDTGTTDTGLDRLVSIVVADPGLNRNLPTHEIQLGAGYADAMNQLILDAIRGTGVANDGTFTASDVRDINAYLQTNHRAEWIELHGDDEDGQETGFHLVQNDGASTRIFGDENAVNTVADGIYHLGFSISNGRLLNEDGNENASLLDVAYWLNEFLAADLTSGTLVNPSINVVATGTTLTGLDQIISMIANEPGLARNVSTSEIVQGAGNADAMNVILVQALWNTGVANDGSISVIDVRDVNAYIRTHHATEWIALHGDDEDGSETGFHLVQNDGAQTYWFGDENAVNTVADGIYHLGFAIENGRLLNEDGRPNASLKDVAFWLNELLSADLAKGTLTNPALNPDPDVIASNAFFSRDDMVVHKAGDQVEVSNQPNFQLANGTIAMQFTADNVVGRKTILAKDAKGFGGGGDLMVLVRDGRLEVQLQNTVTTWTLKSDAGSIRPGVTYDAAVSFGASGLKLYLDGELVAWRDDVTTSLVNNDRNMVFGAATSQRDKYKPNWTGDYFDGTIHNVTLYNRALNRFEVASLVPPKTPAATRGSTGTGLDAIVDLLYADPGLYRNVLPADLDVAANSADAMNHLIVDAIKATGIANDGTITAADVRDVNAYLRKDGETAWAALHGDDEGQQETGFHLVQNDGGTTQIFGDERAVDTVADGVYHLGFAICGDNLLNEDGNTNANLSDVAFWLSEFLASDLRNGTLINNNVDLVVEGTTDTGLDQLVEMIIVDRGLNRNLATSEIAAGAQFANDLNVLIVEAIRETGVANDGIFNAADIRDVNAYLRAHYREQWVILHGDDEDGEETGFHLVQNDGAKTRLFGDDNAIDTVADGIYHLGFKICGTQLLNEDGNANAQLEDVAFWLNELLDADLRSGSLANGQVDLAADATSDTGLDSIIEIIAEDPGLIRNIATSEIVEGAESADAMNLILTEAIRALGVANDGTLDTWDIRDINAYIRAHYADKWAALHGDDECHEETGSHLVQNDGARTQLFGDDNAIDTVADGIYHLGFGICGNRLLNEDGNANATLRDVAFWLNEFLASDLTKGSLQNDDLKPDAGEIVKDRVFLL